ncbi:DNase I-like protein [Meira miltonrushii]|uniref:DNase I-like protein n=1 Tax=Meira miltonrushii TaxID=1280837 RepID=A0A316V443_9BASI|nr:DNase I-like protein [Meira miltonrushii]PWN32317.1 DNase I-like protein [Meira miltonrushii]
MSKSFSTPGLPPTRVQIGTFNCNLQGASSASPDLTHWLVPTISESSNEYNTDPNVDGRPAPDFYAVGFQELLPLHDGFANNGYAQTAIQNTDRAIRRAIRPQSASTRKDGKYPQGGGPEDYTLVATAQVVGIVLYVYARERRPEVGMGGSGINAIPSAVTRIKEIRTSTVSTGFFNLLGNKGAAGVRIVVGGAVPGSPDETFTFVCAHLTAHDHNVARRNADWKNIVSRLVFAPDSVQPLPPPPIDVGKRNANDEKSLDGITEKYETAYSKNGKNKKAVPLDQTEHGVYETSHLFVFGDLNYRIGFNIKPSPILARKGSAAEKLTKKDVKRKINQADWKTLATYDQLTIEHQHSGGPRTLHGLVEPNVTGFGFPPTYKYKIDKTQRKKAKEAAKKEKLSGKRVPGWTDRILWASVERDDAFHGVEPELFRSIMRYTHSDHKPVTAILKLPNASGKHLDSSLRPYAIDPTWRTKRSIGIVMDRGVGFVWCALVAAGAGNVLLGIAELVVVAALSVWWIGVGGGQRGDMGYMLGNLLGRP